MECLIDAEVDFKFFGRNTIFSFRSSPVSVVIIAGALLGVVMDGRKNHRDNRWVWTALFRCSYATDDGLRTRLV